jgi:hypothetical protein
MAQDPDEFVAGDPWDFDVTGSLEDVFGWDEEDIFPDPVQLAYEIGAVRFMASEYAVWAAEVTGRRPLTYSERAQADKAAFFHLLSTFAYEGKVPTDVIEAFSPQRVADMEEGLGDLGRVIRRDLDPVIVAVKARVEFYRAAQARHARP